MDGKRQSCPWPEIIWDKKTILSLILLSRYSAYDLTGRFLEKRSAETRKWAEERLEWARRNLDFVKLGIEKPPISPKTEKIARELIDEMLKWCENAKDELKREKKMAKDENGKALDTKIEVERNGKWVFARPEDLTAEELCEALDRIVIDSDEFVSNQEIAEGYAAIGEAVRRLKFREKKD
jgi:hypothetical protein